MLPFIPDQIDSSLWQTVVDRLDEGVVVIGDRRGMVSYANDEAGRLFGYPRDTMLGLDRDDFASLCHPDRLDGPRFCQMMSTGAIEDDTYEVMTADRRLRITLMRLEAGEASYIVMMLREVSHWRADLIAQTVIGDDMHSPMMFAASYAETLLERIERGVTQSFELHDLSRIVHESIQRALSIWKRIRRLYNTDPLYSEHWHMEPILLMDAFATALIEAEEMTAHEGPEFIFDMPDDLAPVKAAAPHLHAALCALLEAAMSHLNADDELHITARAKGRNAHVTMALHGDTLPLDGAIFDMMPCAIAEQTIVRHGGRIWVVSRTGSMNAFSFTLPLWED
ncbi:MAG: PAS domain-containing protein [Anaerolineae bacterium]